MRLWIKWIALAAAAAITMGMGGSPSVALEARNIATADPVLVAAGVTERMYLLADGRGNCQAGEDPILLLVAHGGGGNPQAHGDKTALHLDGQCAVVAYLAGTRKPKRGRRILADGGCWNVEGPKLQPCWPEDADVDDVGYVLAVAEALTAEFAPELVALHGSSRGGMLAHRVACQRPAAFDAIAVYGTTVVFTPCAAALPRDANLPLPRELWAQRKTDQRIGWDEEIAPLPTAWSGFEIIAARTFLMVCVMTSGGHGDWPAADEGCGNDAIWDWLRRRR